jgi:hypothetical protein
VQQADLLYNGSSIYNNPSKRDSLAYRFHRDGITEIEFTEGVTPPEINAFLDVLARATEPRGADEDLVTLLWEQEFSHIRYAYLAIDDLQESLLEGVETGQGEEDSNVPWPGQGDEASQGLTIVVEDVDPTGEGSGERSDDWNELIPAVDITERCPAHLLELRPEELQELAEEIHLEHSRPLTEVALEILTEVAENERNADRFADLARALGDLIVIALSEADLGTPRRCWSPCTACARSAASSPWDFCLIPPICSSRRWLRSITSPRPTPRHCPSSPPISARPPSSRCATSCAIQRGDAASAARGRPFLAGAAQRGARARALDARHRRARHPHDGRTRRLSGQGSGAGAGPGLRALRSARAPRCAVGARGSRRRRAPRSSRARGQSPRGP